MDFEVGVGDRLATPKVTRAKRDLAIQSTFQQSATLPAFDQDPHNALALDSSGAAAPPPPPRPQAPSPGSRPEEIFWARARKIPAGRQPGRGGAGAAGGLGGGTPLGSGASAVLYFMICVA